MDEEIIIPPFIQDYIDKLDGEGFFDFVKICNEYQKEREEYPGKFSIQALHLNNYNRTAGKNKTLDYDDGLKRIEAKLRTKAYETAKKHGFTGPEPNQPADKEFTKQGEKFMGMIDQARQRPKEPLPNKDFDNIDKLKSQQSYTHADPKVDFKEMEQQPSYIAQSQEQQRATFLEQIKKTRAQQQQQNQQPEI